MKTFSVCDRYGKVYNFFIGESAAENWSLLSKAKQWFYFFHLSNMPSGHGMLECELNENVPKEVIRICADLVRSNTKYKYYKMLKVDYTPYKNVKRGEKIGEVIYVSNKRVSTIF